MNVFERYKHELYQIPCNVAKLRDFEERPRENEDPNDVGRLRSMMRGNLIWLLRMKHGDFVTLEQLDQMKAELIDESPTDEKKDSYHQLVTDMCRSVADAFIANLRRAGKVPELIQIVEEGAMFDDGTLVPEDDKAAMAIWTFLQNEFVKE